MEETEDSEQTGFGKRWLGYCQLNKHSFSLQCLKIHLHMVCVVRQNQHYFLFTVLFQMGKKGKKSGSGKKTRSAKKKNTEPQMTWKEALLAYQ